MIKYKTLNFNRLNDDQDVATVTLKAGCTVQVTRNNKAVGNPPFISHDCKLVSKRSILDEEEGLDCDGVVDFISKSEELAQEVADELDAVSASMAEAMC